MRKILCGVLTIILCSVSIIGYAENDNIQDQQEAIKKEIEKSEEELEVVQSELSSNLQQIQKLDERIENSQKSIDELNVQIEELQSNVDKVKKELNIVTTKYESQKEMLEKRLVQIYEAGETQYLDVVLSSSNIAEFLSNYFLVAQIADYDTMLLEESADRKHEIDLDKEQLDKEQRELGAKKQSQVKTQKILENTKVLRENYKAQLSEEEKEIQSRIDEYNLRFQEINSQILELVKQGIDTKYIGGELAWPVPGYTRITSQYGMRTHPITGVYKLHTGVDIGAPMGANFVAANDGIVVKASYNAAYGNMVIIDHGGGISTLYAHGSEILVQEGEYVKRNQEILKVGSTGYSTGAHAHFEVRINGVVTNPMPYITNGLIPGEEQKNTAEN